MANYSVVRAKTATLTANTEDRVTVTGKFRRLEVVNHGTTRISVALNGTATVDGNEFYVVPAGGALALVDELESDTQAVALDDDTDVVVSLISSSTPAYTVQAF